MQTRAPKIAEFLKNVAIDPAQLNELILKIEKEKLPADVAAKEWVQANTAKVDQWLSASAPKVSANQ
ncbi:Substrate binding domain of ABC-type glycine betaine transport system [compost metagenome]